MTIFAYTPHEPPSVGGYVGYINIQKTADGVRVFVRNRGMHRSVASEPPFADEAQIVVPDSEWQRFVDMIAAAATEDLRARLSEAEKQRDELRASFGIDVQAVVDDLEAWPAAGERDGLSSDYVSALMRNAAAIIRRKLGREIELTALRRDALEAVEKHEAGLIALDHTITALKHAVEIIKTNVAIDALGYESDKVDGESQPWPLLEEYLHHMNAAIAEAEPLLIDPAALRDRIVKESEG